jgi:peroxiredoxin
MTTMQNLSLMSGLALAALLTLGPGDRAAAAAAAAASAPQATAQVGQKAPDFTLADTDGKTHSLERYLAEGKTVVLEWFNPDCPFVRRHHQKLKTMESLYAQNKARGVVWLAINSGAPGNQGAGLERNKEARAEYGIDYPVPLDESGAVGRLYGAKTPPGMYVIRHDGVLVYAGAIDDDPRGEKQERVNYVSTALAANAAGKAFTPDRTDSYGCSVKYRASSTVAK